jgi:subfamily B ATP-binding cassette protein HlyB/CyaB
MQTGLLCLEVIARVFQVPVDLRAVQQEQGAAGGEVTTDGLIRIARGLGFKARLKRLTLPDLARRYPTPVIAVLKDGTFVVILKIDREGDKALLFAPAEMKAREIMLGELEEMVAGEYILLRHGALSSETVFGFRWFLEEILRYKPVMAEVLTGSFVVQLFGFATPLFTQVILDKVLVHRSMSTLEVLAFAFLVVTIFEFLLNLARNYIFIHTASKMDAKLGARLFRHLFSLPFAYFEARKVGNIVARMRELDIT